MMTMEDWMGAILFLYGLGLIVIAFVAVLDIVIIDGVRIVGFSLFGFILCVTGFLMARSVTGGVVGRIRG
ncbi:MAG TPA: hypothetical protein VF707_20015 [Ardenticatenaceae bacterium]|jgi:hypothetical protein